MYTIKKKTITKVYNLSSLHASHILKDSKAFQVSIPRFSIAYILYNYYIVLSIWAILQIQGTFVSKRYIM